MRAKTPSPSSIINEGAHAHVFADLGAIHGIGAPIHVYPLLENGFRAHRKQSIRENNDESAELYGNFADVAERNPYAWNYGRNVGRDAIGTLSKKNRMISFPCKLCPWVAGGWKDA
jgi:hypothetical protein